MPAALLAILMVTIVFQMGYVRNWWVIDIFLFDWGKITSEATVLGPFLIGTLWIFYFSFHKWWKFFLTNFAVDGFFIFVVNPLLLEGWNYHYASFSRLQSFWLMFGISIPIYLYQLWQDEVIVGARGRSGDGEIILNNPFRNRDKGKA